MRKETVASALKRLRGDVDGDAKRIEKQKRGNADYCRILTTPPQLHVIEVKGA